MESKEVQIGGRTVKLQTPGSLAMRWDIAGASFAAPRRAMWAALAVCWRGLAPPKTSLKSHQHDLASFGAAVMDELLDRGYTFAEVNEAALVAYQLACNGLVTQREVNEAADFSEALPEAAPD